jgi:glucokinase
MPQRQRVQPGAFEMSESFPRLVGDVGGTNARFALLRDPDGPMQEVASYPCDQFPSLLDVLRRYLDEHAAGEPPRTCAIGVATAVTGDRVQLTNHPWSFSISELQRRLGVERLLVLNDFSALALSLPALPDGQRRQVGGGSPVPGAPIGLIGPGTGLGVSGLLPTPDGRWQLPIGGEGGHATLSSFDREEAAVLELLHGTFGHVSAERALSGPGLENLHHALATLRGEAPGERSAAQIVEAALAGRDALCVQTLTMFCSLLGNAAGNLALTLGARGGVYIGGGIVPRLGQWFDRSPFRERFEAKGRFRDYLRAIPTYVVQADASPALIGASRALDLWQTAGQTRQ